MSKRALWSFLGAFLFLLSLGAVYVQSAELVPKPAVTSPRLYVIDCGALIFNKPELYNLKREEVLDTNMPCSCFLVVHPKGTLLFDTGLSDSLVGRPIYENVVRGYGQVKRNTLKGQLADIGYAPEAIDYLVLSHLHWDHTGNAYYFTNSKLLIPKEEFDAGFRTDLPAGGPYRYEEYSMFANRVQLIPKDYDVFGDGTVKILSTPGHTKGHVALYVNLKNTGGVVLSGDLFHYREELTLGRMPEHEKTAGTAESRQRIVDFLKQTNSQLWIGHSTEDVKKLRKAPAWYD
jgi:glyoxylase-like metal-dependent hydrolase (beta-lactamase superfamily II)